MKRFIAWRIAILPPALLLINFLGFAYAHLVRPQRAARTPYLFFVPTEGGPLLPAYSEYLKGLVRLDLGPMPASADSVVSAIGAATRASLGLLTIGLLTAIVLGGLVGVASVRGDPPRIPRWLTLFSTVGLAMPSFYVGTLMLLGMFAYLIITPATDFPLPFRGFGWDEHLVLPAMALALRPTVQLAQVTSNLLVGELNKQYIIAARSLGNTWNSLRSRHALRNILAPVILSASGSLRLLVADLILVEWLFGWPGLGHFLAQTLIPASTSRFLGSPLFLNPPIIASVVTLIGALFLLADLTASLLVRVVDPRLRAAEAPQTRDG